MLVKKAQRPRMPSDEIEVLEIGWEKSRNRPSALQSLGSVW